MKTIRVGTRDSKLALIQAELICAAIEAGNPGLTTEIVPMKTTGDRILDRTLEEVGGKGLFVKELDQALLEGRVDITVHSSKDLPMELHPDLPIVAFSRREDPRDVLVLPAGAETIDPAKPIGCAAQRRQLQLQTLYPELETAPIRGNVLTRLQKLDDGAYGALVLAAAGLRRLGLQNRISRIFSPEEMIPAAGQGILAVQARAGEDMRFLHCVHDRDAADCIAAERAFVRELDGGCTAPTAAFAELRGDDLRLTGLYVTGTGARMIKHISGPRTDALRLGAGLAAYMRRDF